MLIRRHKVAWAEKSAFAASNIETEEKAVLAEPTNPEKSEPENGTPKTAGEPEPYTRTSVSRMNVADLKALATELGLTVTEESTGRELKAEILEKLGL